MYFPEKLNTSWKAKVWLTDVFRYSIDPQYIDKPFVQFMYFVEIESPSKSYVAPKAQYSSGYDEYEVEQ